MTAEEMKKLSQNINDLFYRIAKVAIDTNGDKKITQEEALSVYMTASYLFLRKQATEYINNLLESGQSHDKVRHAISQMSASPDWINIFFVDELMSTTDKFFEDKYNQLRPPRP